VRGSTPQPSASLRSLRELRLGRPGRAGARRAKAGQYGRLTDRAIGAAWKARGTASGVGIVFSAFRQSIRAFAPDLFESIMER